MGKTNFQDLTGKKFGKLVCIRRDEDYVSPKGYHLIKWLCKCDCGKSIVALASDLRKGDTSSCGCYRKEKFKKIYVKDLKGKTFGRLTVIKRAEDIIGKNGRNNVAWLCECSCGKRIILKSFSLNTKRYTKSCGCLEKETINNRNNKETQKLEKFLIGKKIGRLTVIKRNGFIKNKDGKRSSAFLCLCECGNERIVRGSLLKKEMITSCGCRKESAMASYLKRYFKKRYKAVIEYSKFKNPETGKSLFFDIYMPDKKCFYRSSR